MLFHVYDDPKPDGFFINEPFGIYRTILDADWFLWILLPLLLVIIVIVMRVAWHLHELPHHRADHVRMRQTELVSALTLLGLFMHWVWAVALFIAYVDWREFEEAVVRILRRSRQRHDDPDSTNGNAARDAHGHESPAHSREGESQA